MPIARWWSSGGSHGQDHAPVSSGFSRTSDNPTQNLPTTSPGSREGHPGDRARPPLCSRAHIPSPGLCEAAAPELPPAFLAKIDVDPDTGCWLWKAARNEKGYAYFGWRKKMLRAHRFAYQVLRGPIPDGLILDHLCRVRHCVNPDHLEPVTNRENLIRGREARRV